MRNLLIASLAAALLCGCESVVKYPPYPTSTEWGEDVKTLGTVKADSGKWVILSLNTPPPDYTYYSALKVNAAKQFSIPEKEVLLGEVTVKFSTEMVGTIRSWEASALAGQKTNKVIVDR